MAVALISALGLILSGVLVELVRARRRQDGHVGDVGEIRQDVNQLRVEVHQMAISQARIETRMAEIMMRRRVTDG